MWTPEIISICPARLDGVHAEGFSSILPRSTSATNYSHFHPAHHVQPIANANRHNHASFRRLHSRPRVAAGTCPPAIAFGSRAHDPTKVSRQTQTVRHS